MKKKGILWATLLLSACGGDNGVTEMPAEPEDVSFRALLCPEFGGTTSIEEPSETVLTDYNNYLHHIEISDLEFNGTIPDVDFSTEMVLAINGGQQPTTGYVVEITQVTEGDNQLNVYYDSKSPTSDCGTGQALTAPYCLVAIPTSDKTVIFHRNELQICGE